MKKIIIVLIAIIVLIVPFFMKDYFYNKQSALDSKEKTIYIDSNYNIDSDNESKDKHIYESSNEDVVTVNEDGTLIPKEIGSSTITIKDSKNPNKKKKIVINVVDIPLDSIVLKKDTIDLKEGSTFDLKEILPDSSIIYSYKYYVNNSKIVTVDNNGKIKALAPGTTDIVISSGSSKTTLKVIVISKELEPTSIVLNNRSFTIKEGTSTKINAYVYPENAKNKKVSWISSNTNIATVDNNGVVYAKNVGSTVISVTTHNGIKTNAYVKVVENKEIYNKEILVSDIKVDQNNINLSVKGKVKVNYTIFPETATNKQVQWTVEDNSVVDVENDGTITGKKAGTTKIVLKASNNKSVVINATVKEEKIDVKSIDLDTNKKTVDIGDIFSLNATINPSNATNKDLTWTSSDKDVAYVNNGRIYAVGVGTATITVTSSNGLSDSCIVVVNKKLVDAKSVTLNTNNIKLEVDGSSVLVATINPEDTSNKSLTWTSSDTKVATVKNGKVIALGEGTAVITVKTINNKTATCNVTVNKKVIMPTGIVLDKNKLDLIVGNTITLNATIKPSNATDKTLTWTSSNTNVATVTNGKVKAVGKGTAIISAKTYNNKVASCDVTVKEINVNSISLNKTKINLIVGASDTLTATITPSNATNKTITWTSSNSNIATVTNGKVIGKSKGTATITAKSSNGKTATTSVIVNEIDVQGISLNKTNATTIRGKNVTLTATITPSNATNKTITWTSSNTKVATVKNGIVTPVGGGSTTITAKTNNGKTVTATITVVSERVHFISHINSSSYITNHVTGDATLLESNGHFAMIDTGINSKKYVRENVLNYLKSNNATTLDFVLISHMHADHMGNVEYLLDNGIRIKNLYIKNYSGVSSDNNGLSYFNSVVATANKYSIPITYLNNKEGQTKTFKYLKFSLTYYNAPLDKLSHNDNCNSIAALVEMKSIDGTSHKLFIPGDNYSESRCSSNTSRVPYTNIINSIKSKNIEVYKLPHHGSRFSGMLDLDSVGLLKPKYIVVTSSEAKINRIKELYPDNINEFGIDRVNSNYSKAKNNLLYVDETSNALVIDCSNKTITINKK